MDVGNEVVAAGTRALFVSPDPLASSVTNTNECEEKPPCTSEPPQVYLRVTTASGGKESVLVSRSELPGHVGEPAQHGALGVDSAALQGLQGKGGSSLDTGYGYASSDGSRVFFRSVDRLTEAAPENSVAKEYVFDVATGEVQYIPGVAGPIVAASADGSKVLFENRAASPVELDLWSAEGDGSVTRVAQLPAPVSVEPYRGNVNVEGRATADGSVFVFATNAPVPAGFDNGGGYSEAYRYETGTGSLVCVSCAPDGVAPAGNAEISHDDQAGAGEGSGFWLGADTRVISADGDRVFFDTPTPLVSAAANGRRDVYEVGGREGVSTALFRGRHRVTRSIWTAAKAAMTCSSRRPRTCRGATSAKRMVYTMRGCRVLVKRSRRASRAKARRAIRADRRRRRLRRHR